MKLKKLFPLLCALVILCAGRVGALNYTFDAPETYQFGRATSVEVVYRETEAVNTDRSKNVALIPPGFGTPTSYLPGSGEYLTPNLVPGAFSGGLVNSLTGYTTTGASYATSGYNDIWYPSVDSVTYSGTGGSAAIQYPGIDSFTWSYEPYSDRTAWYGISYTDVTSDLYYSGGHLGTLKIPALGVNTKIYEGTSSTQLAKGAGHFTDSSIWNGNVCLAGHNRGTNAIFGQIHTLDVGDTITLTTKLGTRTYSVVSVKKISEMDNTDTAGTWENCLTLFTCVRNESEYRWCVRAVETSF